MRLFRKEMEDLGKEHHEVTEELQVLAKEFDAFAPLEMPIKKQTLYPGSTCERCGNVTPNNLCAPCSKEEI